VIHNQPLGTYGRVGGPPDGSPGAPRRAAAFPYCAKCEAAVAPVGYQERKEMRVEEVGKEEAGWCA
jgi:hypothetical protein